MEGRKLLDGSGVGPAVMAQRPWASADLHQISTPLSAGYSERFPQVCLLPQLDRLLCSRSMEVFTVIMILIFIICLVLFQTFVVVIHFFFPNSFNILFYIFKMFTL